MRATGNRREWIIGASAFAAGAAFPACFKVMAHASKAHISGFDKTVRKSVVKVSITEPPTGTGSGFCIATARDGQCIIATASHVVDGNRINQLVENTTSHNIIAWDGTAVPMRMPWCHENWMDVCAFHSKLPLLPLPLAEELPKIGATIYALGFPGGGDYDAAQGQFTGMEVDRSCRIKTSARLIPGYSGGPIINAKGEVIAMAVSIRNDGTVSYGVPLHELHNLRERMRFIDAAQS